MFRAAGDRGVPCKIISYSSPSGLRFSSRITSFAGLIHCVFWIYFEWRTPLKTKDMLTTPRIPKIFLWLLLIALFTEANAQPQWGNLKPGPFSIGYRTLQLTDPSRTYFQPGRPIQVYVWYPAMSFDGKEAMKYGDYFDDIGRDWGTQGDAAKLGNDLSRNFKSGALNPSFSGTIGDVEFKRILSTKIPVKRDARPAKGTFPVLLHIHANGALTQSVMLECLASNGYIVMSISLYGSSPAFYGRGEGTANELLDLTQDLAFVMGRSKMIAGAVPGKIAVVGMLSQLGLLLQSKTKRLDAIACLDCSWNPKLLKNIPYYNPATITLPILEAVNTDFAPQGPTFIDSLRYAERYIVRFKQLPHADFYPFPRIASPEKAGDHVNYDLLMELTVNFLDAVLKGKPEAVEYMATLEDTSRRSSGIASFRKELSSTAPPTEHEFLTWLRYGNVNEARSAWNNYGKAIVSESNLFFVTLFAAREGESHAFEVFEMYISAFPGSPRNSMLYEHLAIALTRKQPQQALTVCERWVKQFPASPHGYRALAEVYVVLGRGEEAVAGMKVALEKAAGLDVPRERREALISDLKKRMEEIERAE